MKQFYYSLIIFIYSLFISAQTTAPTGNSTEVGITKGELSVSLSGSAVYDIPIMIPPGINKIEPKVSLTYNSQGNNGMAGYGWNISGLSTITRIPSTKFHDGVIDEVDFDDLDRFSLDGQRLLIKNGTNGLYGANNTEYETENFSNVKITSFGVHPSGPNYGPEYFIVQYADGSKAYYGSSSDSRTILTWAITFWENSQGIRINYNYNNSNNFLNINSINYGSIGGIEGINKIQFIYKTRERLEQSYIGGQSIINNTILSTIAVTGNDLGYRNYILEYDKTSLNYERLISITEKSGDNSKSYNPTVFEYENMNDEVLISPNITKISRYCGVYTSGQNSILTGDFDNDGRTDFLTYRRGEQGSNLKNTFQLFQNLDSQSSIVNSGNCQTVSGLVKSVFVVNYLKENLPDNFKMGQNQGWCVVSTDPNTTTTTFNTYSGSNNTINLDSTLEYVFPKSCFTDTTVSTVHKEYFPGDFNGDGITDVIVLEVGTDGLNTEQQATGCTSFQPGKTYFVNLDKRAQNSFVNFSGNLEGIDRKDVYDYTYIYHVPDINKVLAGDFNGDGKTDLIVARNHYKDNIVNAGNQILSIDVYSLNDSKVLTKIYTTDFPGLSTAYTKLMIGDFNGDSKADIMSVMNGSTKLFTSTGNSFVVTNSDLYSSSATFPVDFNGDGKTDFLDYYINSSTGDISLRYKYNKNNGVFVNSEYISLGLTHDFLNSNGLSSFIPTLLTSEDQDKRPELCLVGSNGILRINYQKYLSKEKLLKKVTMGNGVKELITYLPIDPISKDNNNSIYTGSSNIENYPNLDILRVPSNKVVVKIEKQSATTYKKQLYSYYGAVSNLEGLGFLGFRATMRTNWHDDNTQIISYITKNDINLRGANIENYSVLGLSSPEITPTSFITKSILTYDSQLLPNKAFKLKNTKVHKFNTLDNINSETITVYDNYNNPKEVTTSLKNGSVTEQTTINKLDYDNQVSGTSYYLGRPISKTTNIITLLDTISTEELYSYTNHLLTKIKKKGHNTDYITEDNIYDGFGNIIKKTISATGLIPRETNYEYDSSGRFLTKSIDIEGLATIYNYNLANGLLNSETNPYGLTTSYLYDSWFKKTKITDYLGKSFTYGYVLDVEKVKITVSGDDGSYSEEVYDDLGRKITSTVKDINGNTSNISYLYDIYDRNYKVSEPYAGGGSPTQWNETQYDVYGRPTQNIAFTGKTTSISYFGLSTTVNDGSKTKLVTKNALGNVVSMTDTPGGTITYTYFANGNLMKTNYDSVEIKIEQNGWGRKTKLTDPSAGEYTYTYNDLGEALTETTPNGTTTYTLNAQGKPSQKTIVGTNTNTITTYTYDDDSKLLTLSTFTDALENNTTTTAYTYDSNKRLASSVETTPYAAFTKLLTYDAFGRVNTETSIATAAGKSSTKTVQHTYKNGQPWQIIDTSNSQILWQTNTVNAKGQLTGATMANGNIAFSNTYDSYGFVSQIKQDRLIAPTKNIMTLNTVFDPIKGNLNSKTNNLFNYNETFDYDLQDRLTTINTDYTNDVIVNNTFDTSDTEGYVAETTGFKLSSELGYLKITGGIGAVNKTLLIGAAQGQTFTFSLDFQRTKGTETLNVYIREQNPITGIYTSYFKKALTLGTNNFTHTVTNNSNLYLRLEKVTTGVVHVWQLDNVLVTARTLKQKTEVFDEFGRITQNELGTYNYSNNDKKYQNTSITLSTEALAHYQTHPTQNISYNVFKSPYQIEELGKDKISFTYNDNNSRSAMFYGGLQDDKLQRRYRKYYSSDGSMEIKVDTQNNNETEFITYIGGDGYTAPVVLKSDGTTQKYLYLHRDYQGSILAITNEAGAIVEKRHFDAWGSIVKVQDGAGNILNGLTVLDRGYTGHEHLQSVNLIHMNGRLYDPKLHRFLQPDNNIQDPFNTQNFNRYGYVLNNPLKYTDPSGEFWQFIAAAIFTSYASGVQASGGQLNPGKWDSNAWTNAALGGASFGLSTVATNYANEYIVNYNKPPEIVGNSINGGDINNNTHSYVSNADIHLPTQHNSLGFNWTYLSEGKPGEKFIYNVANTISVFGQFFMGRGVGDGSMRNLNGTTTSTDEGILAFLNIGAFSTFGIGTSTMSVADGSFYSVAYETRLSSELYPTKGAYSHFKAANTALDNAIASDVTFANSMKELGISIPKTNAGTVGGGKIPNWVWHHSTEEGIMQLVPQVQHTNGSIFWQTLHPGGRGGMSIWGGGYSR